jgi:hypothetical protein
VLDRVAPAVERAPHADAVVRVARDLAAPAVRLVDDRLELVEGQRRLRDEPALRVDPRAVVHVDLDPVRAVRELLARRLARLDRPVDELRARGMSRSGE